MRASTIVVLGLATLGIASPYKGDMGDNHGHEVDECDDSGSGHGGGEYGDYHGSGGENHGNGEDEHGSDDHGEDEHGSDEHGSGSDGHDNGEDHHDSDGSHGDNGHGHGHGHCISRAEAKDLSQAYAALIGAFKESDAHHWLADSFLDYSDSINTFTNKP
ncbi:hypothetical protein IMZ48_17720, partial [Candidatus Bathyarchaeota archaeon]|nr:hypothetical protein [Candidatus Bathyarchaeota archaeon]